MRKPEGKIFRKIHNHPGGRFTNRLSYLHRTHVFQTNLNNLFNNLKYQREKVKEEKHRNKPLENIHYNKLEIKYIN